MKLFNVILHISYGGLLLNVSSHEQIPQPSPHRRAFVHSAESLAAQQGAPAEQQSGTVKKKPDGFHRFTCQIRETWRTSWENHHPK